MALGFCQASFQGVEFRSTGSPCSMLTDLPVCQVSNNEPWWTLVGALKSARSAANFDPEVETRISQYEMAFRMQSMSRS